MNIEQNSNVIHSPLENKTLEEKSKDTKDTMGLDNKKKRRVKTLKEKIADKKVKLSLAQKELEQQQQKIKKINDELNKLITLEKQEQVKQFFKVCDSKNIDIETLLANIDLFVDNNEGEV